MSVSGWKGSRVLSHALPTWLPASLGPLIDRCGDPDVAMSGEFSFTTPQPVGPEAFPQAVGVIGDLGQTHNSSTTLQHVLASDPPVRA